MTQDSSDELVKIDRQLAKIETEIQKLEAKKVDLLKRKEEITSSIHEKKGLELSKKDWNATDFPWSDKLKTILKTTFCISTLRPFQMATMNVVLSKHDCLLIMPTGGGKSLCFQMPALVSEGITLVVSPLVSLMEDQCMALKRYGVKAVMMHANLTRKEVNDIYKEMLDKKSSLKLLYVTPEKLAKSKQFMTKLQKMYELGRFSLLAVDEVHCCSQWGHDFRPDYKFLGIMKRQFPNISILGLTATATPHVLQDVKNILSIESCVVFTADFNRPNLKYEVRLKPASQKESIDEISKLIKNRFKNQSGIIYCCSVKETEDVTKELQARDVKARCYHAQLDATYRSQVHQSWTCGTIDVIVATIAFGMGIDKPNVRYVIHHSMSKSMENYYQESGRAGRDDEYAECILFYRLNDLFRLSTIVFTEKTGLEKLYGVGAYCIDVKRCRRAMIADYFAVKWESKTCNGMCDHCAAGDADVRVKDITMHFKNICSILDFNETKAQRLTAQMLIEAWLGKGQPKHRVKSISAVLPREQCERIVAFLLLGQYLAEDIHFTPYNNISYLKQGGRDATSHPIEMEFVKVSNHARCEVKSPKSNAEVKVAKSGKRNKDCIASTKQEKTSPLKKKKKEVSASDASSGQKGVAEVIRLD